MLRVIHQANECSRINQIIKESKLKLVSYSDGEKKCWGVYHNGDVLDLRINNDEESNPDGKQLNVFASDVLHFIQSGETSWKTMRDFLESIDRGNTDINRYKVYPKDLLPPISNPSKIVAVGWNYWDHLREQRIIEPPEYPVLFPKFPSSIIGHEQPITWNPSLTQQVDFEAELGVVIGKLARDVSPEHALDYVFGYCNLNDISARDLQYDPKGGRQYTRGKSLDTFCPIGPYLVTKEEVPDPQNLSIRCWVNGKLMQDSNTAEMIRSVADIISFISHGITLLPGDILATGTPSGVGHFRKPATFLNAGDLVEMEIEGLGHLSNPCQHQNILLA